MLENFNYKISPSFIVVKLSYAKSLRRALKDKNENLFSRLQPIEDAARSVLTYTASKFPYYTPHNFSHSLNVEENLNWLIPDEIKTKMNAYEIFFLLIAAWLHDWGMVASKEEKAEDVRKSHHIRTEEHFEKLHDKVHLSPAEARVIGRICRGHREEDLFDQKYDDVFFGSNIPIRVRFLAAVLRVADECDVTANRTPEIIYYTLKPEGASEEEFRKHLSITGIGKAAPHKLVLNGVAWSPKGVRVIEGVKKRIQDQLNSVKTILANHGVLLDIIEAHIDTRGFINKPIAFDLDKRAIVRLLIGTALYSRKDVAIRELLQNAVDTCRLRKLIDANYKPCIEIEIGEDQISFEDNGMGMNFDEAFEYFSKKGSSFYVSKNVEEILESKEFDPISKFGIGVLSCFIIADKMVVETKKKNCAPCRFTITDLAEGWTYEEGSKQNPGTKITLFLNDEGKKIDFLEALKHYAKKVTVPIFIRNLETKEKWKFEQKWDYNIPEVLEELNKDERERFFQSKPELTLNWSSDDLEVTYYLFKNIDFTSIRYGNCFLSNHGIYVGRFSFFPCGFPVRWIALINLKSNIIDLTVSREDIVHNEKFEKFLEILYDSLIEVCNQFTNEREVSQFEKCKKFSKLMDALFRGNVGMSKEEPAYKWLRKFYTKRNYPVLLKSGLTYLNGNEILSQKFSKVIHYELPIEHHEEHMKVVSKILLSQINENEVFVFDFPPHFRNIEPSTYDFLCGFCELLKSKQINVECWKSIDLIAKLKFNKEKTPLDQLLPSNSFFTHMPGHLRGGVFLIKPFRFSSPLKTLYPHYYTYYRLIARELFRFEPEITEIYDNALSLSGTDYKLLSEGQFVYDIDDPFLNFLVSKANFILTNEPIKILVKRYLRLLAVHCLSSSLLEDSLLVLIEKSLAELLGYQNYVPFKDRISKLALIISVRPV